MAPTLTLAIEGLSVQTANKALILLFEWGFVMLDKIFNHSLFKIQNKSLCKKYLNSENSSHINPSDQLNSSASFDSLNPLISNNSSSLSTDSSPIMILLPPPNVTGSLHIGHALCYTLQDTLSRYYSAKGTNVLFQPGLDHAGIVTQLIVEKELAKNGILKTDIGREKFLQEVWKWKESSGCKILKQMEILGIACDFSRLTFTMDDGPKKAVKNIFISLYKKGLIYKDKRLVNWDPAIESAISDLEVVEREISGCMYYIKYKIVGNNNKYITIATTRPETIFADVAIAVNPSDERYKKYATQTVQIPLTERIIPIVYDEYADLEKGTGCVKITPAHDFNDFEVGVRHGLEFINILNKNATLNENVPEKFQNLDRFTARKLVIEELENAGLLEKVEKIKHMVPHADRSGSILEPYLSEQWFLNVDILAQKAIKTVKNKETKLLPEGHWENLYFEWLNNIKPWCISRQIWWGHRIPAWYDDFGNMFVCEDENAAKQEAFNLHNKDVELKQDDDVLDTWFSSAMWPFTTLGWVEEAKDAIKNGIIKKEEKEYNDDFNNCAMLEKFYGNIIVITGFDIIFFWVSRMIMMGLFAFDKTPFKFVYIHGLVRDEKGQKMSKSKGNVLDPIDLCADFGPDAVRYSLLSETKPGRDLKINDKSVEISRNFFTKLWNAARFAQMYGFVFDKNFDIEHKLKFPFSKWIVCEIDSMIKKASQAIEICRFDEYASCIYSCLWANYCDWFLEFVKPVIQQDDLTAEKYEYGLTIIWCVQKFIQVLNPVAPFITQELADEFDIQIDVWPVLDVNCEYFTHSRNIKMLMELISSVRSFKRDLNMENSAQIEFSVLSENQALIALVGNNAEVILRMCGGKWIGDGEVKAWEGRKNVAEKLDNLSYLQKKCISIVGDFFTLSLFIDRKNVDISKEIHRLQGELELIESEKSSVESRLNNEKFMQKATKEAIEENSERFKNAVSKIAKINELIKTLQND